MALDPGTNVAGFRVLGTIIPAGLGESVLADREDTGRTYLLVPLPTDIVSDADAVASMRADLAAASRWEHAHLVPAFDVAIAGDRGFVAFPHIPGPGGTSDVMTVQHYLQRSNEGLPEPAALAWTTQVAAALAYAHRQQTSHGNLHPGWIWIDENKLARVAGFGLWRFSGLLADHSDDHALGLVHVAPELHASLPGDAVQPTADCFAFGVLALAMLTGCRPSDGPVSHAAYRFDPRWTALLESCLHQDPAKRPAKGNALVQAIRPLLDKGTAFNDPSHAARGYIARTNFNPEAPPRPTSTAPDRGALLFAAQAEAEAHADLQELVKGETSPRPASLTIPAAIGSAVVLLLIAVAIAIGFSVGETIEKSGDGLDTFASNQLKREPAGVKSASLVPGAPSASPPAEPSALQDGAASAVGDSASATEGTAADDEPTVDRRTPQTFVNALGMTMVGIPGGEFLMGSPDNEPDRVAYETQHLVTITRAFHISATEVTQAQWQAVMGERQFTNHGDNLPVHGLSWFDAVAFCEALTRREGRTYRLPTEAEWEYACRAGATTTYSTGDSVESLQQVAWFGGDHPEGTSGGQRQRPVGVKSPNAWGLYDMHGNETEWVADWFGGDYGREARVDPTGASTGVERVARGGAWWSPPGRLRAAQREFSPPSDENFTFRVVAEILPTDDRETTTAARPSTDGDRRDAIPTTGEPTATETERQRPGDDGTIEMRLQEAFDFTRGGRPATEAQAAQRAWAAHQGVDVEMTNSIGMKLRFIPPGEYQRGSPADEAGRGNTERQHRVRLTRGFGMGSTEVTQAQWERVMGNNPSRFKGDDRPVEKVSWNDAVEFCRRLTELERRAGRLGPNQSYRLPTEAEWEYAARAGTTTTYYTGDDERDLAEAGWYNGNSNRQTQPVGRKQANAFGLYDMHGNVWEWCSDWYGAYPAGRVDNPTGPATGSMRVLRGGSWTSIPANCRAANRSRNTPDFRHDYRGFRVLLDFSE